VADEGVSAPAGEPTREQFLRETSPRRGAANPEQMGVPGSRVAVAPKRWKVHSG
jgi:hypothetical protein